MQEFSSVTASSYDADALTPLLNGKAAEGWTVVSIVSAGTNIVAYLSRESDESAGAVVVGDAFADDTIADVAVADAVIDVPVVEATPTETVAESAAPYVPAAAVAATTATDEAAGWATAPAETTSTADDSATAPAAQVADEPAAVVAAPAEPAPVAEPTVPAGWYADPSGRFELRYWDGTAWTEHVSRAGQQFTDPPVA
jgi:hypothetical protein